MIASSVAIRWRRLLELLGQDAPAAARANATAFRQLFGAIIAVESWDTVARQPDDPTMLAYVALATMATLGAALCAAASRANAPN